MIFPKKAWIPFCICPTSALLNLLACREAAKFRRRGAKCFFGFDDHLETKESEWIQIHNLPKYTQRVIVSPEEWEQFKKLNSFMETKREAYQMQIRWQRELESGQRGFKTRNPKLGIYET